MEFKHIPMNGANYTDADIKRLIAEYNVQFIKLQFVDINGQVKNLAVPSEHIDRVLNNDISNSDNLFAEITAQYKNFADKNGLFLSGGTDSHQKQIFSREPKITKDILEKIYN